MHGNEADNYWMQLALDQARLSACQGEVPVGAVLVKNNELIACGHNCPITTNDPSAHAEIVTMRQAATQLNNYRLVETTLYVTLEPCLMCVGAMVHARIEKVVFGASDTRGGAVVSVMAALNLPSHNHRVAYAGGVAAAPCGALLREFFKLRR